MASCRIVSLCLLAGCVGAPSRPGPISPDQEAWKGEAGEDRREELCGDHCDALDECGLARARCTEECLLNVELATADDLSACRSDLGAFGGGCEDIGISLWASDACRRAIGPAIVPAQLATPCQTGSADAYLHGDPGDPVHAGIEAIEKAEWRVWGEAGHFTLAATTAQAVGWQIELRSEDPAGRLDEGLHEDAQKAGLASPGHPGLDVLVDGRGCDELEGKLEVHENRWRAGRLELLSATFERRCEGSTATLLGCVAYEDVP